MFWGSHLPPTSHGRTGFLGLWAQRGPRTPGSLTSAGFLRGLRSGRRLTPRRCRALARPGEQRSPARSPRAAHVVFGLLWLQARARYFALKHSKMTFASHFQKTATVRIEGGQPQGGDPAPQPAPPETTGVGEGGAQCVSLGLRK